MASQKIKVKDKPVADKPVKARDLLRWYDHHRRSFPWRAMPGERVDPYRVWLSEIMLQQTTTTAVVEYFNRFVARWPSVKSLAEASRDEVLRMWAGLGYYRRAHLLHDCAQFVVENYGGRFPEAEPELLKLPGVGAYTAAAVTAIAFGQKANVVDGNVERVMARIFALRTPLSAAKAKIRAYAAGLVSDKRCGDYAQALMDLGATVCTPRNPDCSACPWSRGCRAFALGKQNQYPRKTAKKARPVRHAWAFVVQDKRGNILLQRREEGGLLGGMMEVPSSPWSEDVISLSKAKKYAPCRASWQEVLQEVEHVFSHFTLRVRVVVACVSKVGVGCWVPAGKLDGEALPSVMRKIVQTGLSAL